VKIISHFLVSTVLYNVFVDRHHVDADPDPTFYFDANPDSYPVPADSLTLVEKSNFFYLFTAVLVYIVLSFSSASSVS
jgi:hypothetical protein